MLKQVAYRFGFVVVYLLTRFGIPRDPFSAFCDGWLKGYTSPNVKDPIQTTNS